MTTRFKVILHADTFTGRKNINFKDESTFNAEINVSQKMSEKKLQAAIDLTLIISSKNQGKSIDFEIMDNKVQRKSSLSPFSNFFSINISQAMKFYLKKRLEETKAEDIKC